MDQTDKTNQADSNETETASGTVLPFRKPSTSPHPTLQRRSQRLQSKRQTREPSVSKQGTGSAKIGFAGVLQVVLLALAFLLALKNCGKL